MTKHRHQEWLRFLRQIDRSAPKDRELLLIAENYATHKHLNVQAWLAKHPRFHMHFVSSQTRPVQSQELPLLWPAVVFCPVMHR